MTQSSKQLQIHVSAKVEFVYLIKVLLIMALLYDCGLFPIKSENLFDFINSWVMILCRNNKDILK